MNNRILVKQEVAIAQGILDKIVPGKVKVSAEYDSPYGKSTWTESMDKFYTDCMLFVGFFKQRAKYMNASIEEQRAFDGHPATY